MFKKLTTFVIGAGASCELGFPSGATLLKDIEISLNFREELGRLTTGDHHILDSLRRYARDNDVTIADLINAARRISSSAGISRSIDNVIHQLNDSELVPIVGKIAIAKRILEAERRSALASEAAHLPFENWSSISETWLSPFAQMLTTDVQVSGLEHIFDNLRVITFNYDRSLEQSIPTILNRVYGISWDAAYELVRSKLKIYHPYGRVGLLPWISDQSPVDPAHISVPYGTISDLISVSKGVMTFTEQVRSEQLELVRQAVQEAERLVFLGFGFHNQNMELLTPELDSRATEYFGTTYGLPSAAHEPVYASIYRCLRPAGRAGTPINRTASMSCASYLWDYFVPITSP